MRKHGQVIGGILLVSGTAVGAGMLALPVSTGMAGFIPSIVLFVAYWLFMTFTALLFLEVNLWKKEETNLITMAKDTLGKSGEVVSWILYIFLLYALTTAYIAGSGPTVIDSIQLLTGITLPYWVGPLPLMLIFGICVYKGTKSVDYLNRVLMIGLIVAYFVLIVTLTPHVQKGLLSHMNWVNLTIGSSIVATSFGFHIIIPTLTTYFKRDIDKLRKVLLIGSFIPLVVYVLWEFVTLGIIPLEGANGIIQGYQRGDNGAYLVAEIIGHGWLGDIARGFSFFAIITSFLAVSMSLSDFLADGLKIKKNPKGKMMLYALTFLPPLIFSYLNPRAFLDALEYAGAYGVVLLLGLLPALMVWSGRYKKNLKGPYQAPGGKLALVFTIAFSVLVIIVEIGNRAGWYH